MYDRRRFSDLCDRICSKTVQFSDQFTLIRSLISSPLSTLKSADPANTSHCSIKSLDVKLIFQTHGETVQWAHGLMVLLEVLVKLIGSLDGNIKTNLEQILILWRIGKMES